MIVGIMKARTEMIKRLTIGALLFVISYLGQRALSAEPAKLAFDTYSGYFVSNKFEPNAAESFVVIHDQEAFNKVFGAAFVMRDTRHRLPKDAFKSLIVIAPIIIGSFAIGLPFGIKGVALSGSVVLVGIFPWILKYAFRDTSLTLQRLGQAILCPIALSLAGVFSGELALRFFAPQARVLQLSVAALGFAAAYALSALVPRVRKEVCSFKDLLGEMRMFRQFV